MREEKMNELDKRWANAWGSIQVLEQTDDQFNRNEQPYKVFRLGVLHKDRPFWSKQLLVDTEFMTAEIEKWVFDQMAHLIEMRIEDWEAEKSG